MIKPRVNITCQPTSSNKRAKAWPATIVNIRKIFNKEGDSFEENPSLRKTN